MDVLEHFPAEKKSEYLLCSELENELIKLWGFNPYKILTNATTIHRSSTPFKVECKNCNTLMQKTFAELENMMLYRDCYCTTCHGSYDPVYRSMLPNEFKEENPVYVKMLDYEYNIMSAIEEHYGFQPYTFKSLDAGKKVTLEHSLCSSVFSATPTMLFEHNIFSDKYTGGSIKMPYCPKCNPMFVKDGINYGGERYKRSLLNYFEAKNAPMPYEFDPEDIYRFRGQNIEMVVTCKHCKHKFSVIPKYLFDYNHTSHCPYCGGISPRTDSAEHTVQQAKIALNSATRMREEKTETSQIPPQSEEEEIPFINAEHKHSEQEDIQIDNLTESSVPPSEPVQAEEITQYPEDISQDNEINESVEEETAVDSNTSVDTDKNVVEDANMPDYSEQKNEESIVDLDTMPFEDAVAEPQEIPSDLESFMIPTSAKGTDFYTETEEHLDEKTADPSALMPELDVDDETAELLKNTDEQTMRCEDMIENFDNNNNYISSKESNEIANKDVSNQTYDQIDAETPAVFKEPHLLLNDEPLQKTSLYDNDIEMSDTKATKQSNFQMMRNGMPFPLSKSPPAFNNRSIVNNSLSLANRTESVVQQTSPLHNTSNVNNQNKVRNRIRFYRSTTQQQHDVCAVYKIEEVF